MSKDTQLIAESDIPAPRQQAFDWHERPGAIERLTPPWTRADVLENGGIRDGGRVVLRVNAPWPRNWVALHESFDHGRRFVDTQASGPMPAWRHEHLFEDLPDTPDAFRMVDRIAYRAPGGPLRNLVDRLALQPQLRAMFAHRHRILRDDLTQARTLPGPLPHRVAVSGLGGLLGKALAPALATQGAKLIRLRRNAGPATDSAPGEAHYNPASGEADTQALAHADALVHLAGEPIMGRWSAAKKKAILDSRVQGTAALAKALAAIPEQDRPSTLVCASAIGYYGDRADHWCDESSPQGPDFLADVAHQWEQACEPAQQAGVRVVHLRIGVVLDPRGGALQPMLLPFKLGLGGPIGAGRFYWSWVHIEDVVGAIVHALADPNLQGPVNVTAPEPVTQRDFAQALGQALARPALLPAPVAALNLRFGKELVRAIMTASIRVKPAALIEHGYAFRFPTLEPALRSLLGRPGAATPATIRFSSE
ncbi:MAG: TIGR01777 family oxidoreductase [Planctomycetota bacterium]